VGHRDHIHVDQVLNFVLETKALVLGMAAFLVEMVVKIEVPTLWG
jgi:hypothetical protein